MRCDLCKKVLHLGDWPHCPHESTRPERAQRFAPIVVFKKADGTYSFPASSSVPTPDGSQRVEITTRRQADRLTREVNGQLREEKARIGATPLDGHSSKLDQLRRLARGERVSIPDHDAHGNLIMRELDGSAMRGKFREYVDRLVTEQSGPNFTTPYDPGFHVDILENDSSNRLAHEDASSGWKSRRD